MSVQNGDDRNKRERVLEELRSRFGQDRSGQPPDIDGLGLLSTLLRRIPGEDGGDLMEADLGEELSPQALRRMRELLRGEPREQGPEVPAEQDRRVASDEAEQSAAEDGATLRILIQEIPHIREHFGEWLGGVEDDCTPSSSTREELEQLLATAEFRMKALKVMVHRTQREIDSLTLAIRAGLAQGTD